MSKTYVVSLGAIDLHVRIMWTQSTYNANLCIKGLSLAMRKSAVVHVVKKWWLSCVQDAGHIGFLGMVLE